MKSYNDIISENINKFLINEYAAIRKYDNAYELGKEIYKDLLSAYKTINFNSRVTNKFQKTYRLQVGNIYVPVKVIYPNKGEKYSWYYYSRKIELNIPRPYNQNEFFEVFFHEVTHAIDHIVYDINGKKRGKHFGNEFYEDNAIRIKGQNTQGKRTVNNILYRLWDTSERNAYQLSCLLGETYCQKYIDDLRSDIMYLKKIKSTEAIWKFLISSKEIARPSRANSSTKAFKNFFIKKSLYLLDSFSDKMFKNLKYFNDNPLEAMNIESDKQNEINHESEKTKTMIIIGYGNDGSIDLVKTRSKSVFDEILKDASEYYTRVILSQDKSLEDFLIENNYTRISTTWRRWVITNKNWVNDIESKFNFKQIYPMSQEQIELDIKRKNDEQNAIKTSATNFCNFINNESNCEKFVNELFDVICKNQDSSYNENTDRTRNYVKSFKRKVCGFVVINQAKSLCGINNEGSILINVNEDWGSWNLDDLEWYINGDLEEPETHERRFITLIKREVRNIVNYCERHNLITNEENQEEPKEEPKGELKPNAIPIFRLKLGNGQSSTSNTFELRNVTKDEIVQKLKERFPKMSDENIEKLMNNPSNYPKV